MSSGLISELDHQLTDLAHLIMAPREITLPYVMAQLKCDQEEANARLDLSNSMFIPQSWALH
jgi:hypothetical protein